MTFNDSSSADGAYIYLIFSSFNCPQLRTDSNGVAHWGSCAFTVGKFIDLHLLTVYHLYSLKLNSHFLKLNDIYSACLKSSHPLYTILLFILDDGVCIAHELLADAVVS
jgi:hypothetical protein